MKPPLAPSTWIGMSSPVAACSASSAAAISFDRLVGAGEGHAERGDDADRVLVADARDLVGRHAEPSGRERHLAQLDVEVAGELVPADLHRTADQVRPVGRLCPAAWRRLRQRHLSARPPSIAASLEPGGRAADRRGGVGRVPQVGEDVHAARLDLRRLRILVLVDHVLVDALVHQLTDLGRDPGRAEGREVLPRVAVEQQLVVDERVGDRRSDALLGHAPLRQLSDSTDPRRRSSARRSTLRAVSTRRSTAHPA